MASQSSPQSARDSALDILSNNTANNFPSPSLTKPASDPAFASSTDRELSPARAKSVSLSSPSSTPRSMSPHKHTTSLSQIPETSISSVSHDRSTWTGSDYLTALASQERKVLELKDELQKAEDELAKLKNQWAAHESTKRRNESKRLHRMRPMSMISPKRSDSGDDLDGSSAWMYEEMARRKALLGNARPSHRRVFSGSRHARTLSLLAPERKDASDEQVADVGPSKSSTEPNLVKPIPEKPMEPYEIPSPQQQDLIMQHGKKMASELRDGLWTFWADLRQVTVGDEARSGQHQAQEAKDQDAKPAAVGRKKRSPTRRPTSLIVQGSAAEVQPFVDPALVDMGAAFWREEGLEDEPKQEDHERREKPAKNSKTPQKLPLHLREVDGEVWETWDSSLHTSSPVTSTASNSVSSPATTGESSPRTSLSSDATPRQVNSGLKSTRDNPIPWPSLSKLTPGQLKRTASHLVDEWERAISPGPQDERRAEQSTESFI